MTDPEELLAELRPVAFAIAYRMLGSVSDAEDLVQEALLRTLRALKAGEHLASPRAFIATVTTRLAINELSSARARREAYVGTWLPEPIVADPHDDPEQMAELSASLSMAFLVVLERLSPMERAVFLLREAFDYSYEEIARIVDRGEANCRQIFARARSGLATTPRPTTARPCCTPSWPPPATATSISWSTSSPRMPSPLPTGVAGRVPPPSRSTGGSG